MVDQHINLLYEQGDSLRLIMVADGTCDYPDDRQGALHALHLLARLGDRAAVDFLAGSSAGLAAPSGSFV
jgi:hypothetical protein